MAHIDYNVSYGGLTLLDILDIHLKNGRTVIRLKRYNKRYTTRFLENRVNIDERVRGRFIESLKNIRGVFEKIGMLLSIIDDNVDNLYRTFNRLTRNRGLARKKYIFYLLYVLFSRVPKGMIIEYRDKGMLRDLDQIFDSIDGGSCSQIGGMVSRFIDRYSADRRERRLTEREILELKEAQNSICPLCNNLILQSDKIHVDHKIPLSKGGKDAIENMQITHDICNLNKGSRLP